MKWTTVEEKDLISYLRNKKTYSEISLILKRTKKSIKEKVNALGFSSKTFYTQKEKIKCLNCENEFEISSNDKEEKNRKFCSSSCSAIFNNKKRKKESSVSLWNNKVKEISYCIACGNNINRNSYKYCSNKCQLNYQQLNYIEKWKKGEVDGCSGEFGVSKYIKRYLFNKFDNKCSNCGWNEINIYTNNIPLEVEHIDGNATNNREENLILLCPNCHSLTPTFGALNKGKGRKSRYNAHIGK